MNHPIHTNDRYVLVVVDDLFFSAKITEMLRQIGATPLVAEDMDEVRNRIGQHPPAAIIVDLGLVGTDPVAVIDHLKHAPETRDLPMMAYGAHTDQAMMTRAADAGCEQVLPRSSFVRLLPDFIQASIPSEDRG